MNYRFIIDKNPNPHDLERIQKGLDLYNQRILGQKPKELAIYLKDENHNIVGGIFGLTYTDSLHIILLWIDEKLRHQGFGTQLVQAIEEESIKRHCRFAFVDTFSFQGPDFYSKMGYECIGAGENILLGHSKMLFRKDLAKQ